MKRKRTRSSTYRRAINAVAQLARLLQNDFVFFVDEGNARHTEATALLAVVQKLAVPNGEQGAGLPHLQEFRTQTEGLVVYTCDFTLAFHTFARLLAVVGRATLILEFGRKRWWLPAHWVVAVGYHYLRKPCEELARRRQEQGEKYCELLNELRTLTRR